MMARPVALADPVIDEGANSNPDLTPAEDGASGPVI